MLECLQKKWEVVKEILEDNSQDEDIKQKFECLIQQKKFNLDQLELNLGQKAKIGIKLACSPPKSKAERTKFFSVILRAGTPIAIWLRANQIEGIDDLETETDKWIKHKYLADLNLWLDLIKKEREKAYFGESILGNHLVIFCDNPTRRPTKPLPLPPSQPLSAPK